MASEAAPEDGPRYDVMIHRRAQDELDALGDVGDVEPIKAHIRAAAACRQPKTHPRVDELEDYPGYLRIDAGHARVICEVVPPEFRVLLVDKRRVVYGRIDTALQRAADADGGGAHGE